MRHHHVGQDHVYGLLFEQRQCRFPAFRFQADKAERLADGDAEFTDALLVVDDQHANAKIFFAPWVIHWAFPKVCETTSINCCTRKGFSTQGAPVSRKVATVSSLAMSPVIKMMREAKSGRWRATQACTWPPSTPPGVRMSDTTPRKLPFSSMRRASTPD